MAIMNRGTVLAAAWWLALCAAGPACAAVQVIVGPTPIVDGEARAAGDITVLNEKLAFAIAVQTAVPYGIPRGAIIDVAPVTAGSVGRDRVVFADFIPNNWSAWPNSYSHVEILERSPERAVIRATRDWGRVTIATVYRLEANSDHIEIQSKMTNDGAVALPDLLSGLTLWPKGGFLFGVPGMAGVERGKTDAAISDRVVAYDEHWTVALHAPYLDHIGYGSKDMFSLHSLAPGASRTFDAWLQVGSRGDLGPVVNAEIERKHLQSGQVRGVVMGRNGKRVEQPVVVIEKQGKPFAWIVGHNGEYQATLPVGDYGLYATAKSYSQSAIAPLEVAAGGRASLDFRDLENPGGVEFEVTDARNGKPLDARIAITQGQKPLVEFLGRKTFFTELDQRGRAHLALAPGAYVFAVSSGGGFLSPSEPVSLVVAAGKQQTAKVALTPLFDPPAQGWYSADLHHHADQAEAVTPPADLARSQLAAGLDLLFVSDHDSTVNHAALQKIADRRGMAFIAGVELSPSWGHFNAYPLNPGQKLAVDTSTATVEQIFVEARRQGAIVVQANHAFIPYGYFASLDAGVVPGGFDPKFDLVEINAANSDDDPKVLRKLWEFWNAGHRYYLTAGTDTHDVWNEVSGRVRMFAHVDGAVTATAFAQALKAGHAYASYGPLIFPDVMFGDQIKLKPGEPFNLGFELRSVAGLKGAQLIGAGAVVASKTFAGAPRQVRVDFPLTAVRAGWCALEVEDQSGRKAYTDPVWLDVLDFVKSEAKLH
jgi:hypothetical protein